MLTLTEFQKMKNAGEKIAMVTCADSSFAALVEASGCDCVLVGDSLGMTMHGFATTVPVTLEMMVLATAAVARGCGGKFIVADMPFCSFRKSLPETVGAAAALMQAGAQAVKLEGAAGNLEAVRHLVDSGIPVMGHVGLTPQSVHQFGGFKVQGKTEAAAAKVKSDALALEEAGCFALVVECVPEGLGTEIAKALSIPAIGIGAGKETDGQVLVLADLLGLNPAFRPKFAKAYLDGAALVKRALDGYAAEVKAKEFPGDAHRF